MAADAVDRLVDSLILNTDPAVQDKRRIAASAVSHPLVLQRNKMQELLDANIITWKQMVANGYLTDQEVEDRKKRDLRVINALDGNIVALLGTS